MVGLLFGLHPMAVETISWIGERKALLAALFAVGLLMTLAWLLDRWWVNPQNARAKRELAITTKLLGR